jgi:hypothetical protein
MKQRAKNKEASDASFVDSFLKDFQSKAKKQRQKEEQEERKLYDQHERDQDATSSLISMLVEMKKSKDEKKQTSTDTELLLKEKQRYLQDLRRQVLPGSNVCRNSFTINHVSTFM